MSLLRLAFWLAVLVFLLPSDPQQQARLHAIVMSALGRVNTYCDPSDRTCGAGGEIWATFVRKAEFGLRLIGDIVGGARPPSHGPPPPDNRWNGRADPRRPRSPQDTYPPSWRGPSPGGPGGRW
jgi:hypothetical protein